MHVDLTNVMAPESWPPSMLHFTYYFRLQSFVVCTNEMVELLNHSNNEPGYSMRILGCSFNYGLFLCLWNEQSINHICMKIESLDVYLYIVICSAWCDSANTSPHQLHWGDWVMRMLSQTKKAALRLALIQLVCLHIFMVVTWSQVTHSYTSNVSIIIRLC